MKKKSKIIIGLIILIGMPSLALLQIKFNIIENLININVENNILRNGYIDEIWDFEKVPSKNRYYNWVIGTKAEEITAVRIASGSVVTFVGAKELNMDYKSLEDYDVRNGHSNFINFIESYNNKE